MNGWNGRTPINNTNPLTIHKTNMTSIGQKFLDLRITKTLNKFNEQQSRSVQTRSSTDFQSPSVNVYTPPTDKTNVVPIPKQIKV